MSQFQFSIIGVWPSGPTNTGGVAKSREQLVTGLRDFVDKLERVSEDPIQLVVTISKSPDSMAQLIEPVLHKALENATRPEPAARAELTDAAKRAIANAKGRAGQRDVSDDPDSFKPVEVVGTDLDRPQIGAGPASPGQVHVPEQE